MYLEIDLATIPPTTVLKDADDFEGLKIVVLHRTHGYVTTETLTALAGERGTDEAWQAGLAAMSAYAEQHGWTSDAGIRAHIVE